MSAALNDMALQVAPQNPVGLQAAPGIKGKLMDRLGGVPNGAGVADLLVVFRATGGLVRGDELAMMLQQLRMGDVASLGRAMASAEICSFEWRSAFWIPMFQFDLDNLSFKAGPRQIMRELQGVFDGWLLTVWFAQPNSWLEGHKPVDVLASNLPAVIEAARADRFVALG